MAPKFQVPLNRQAFEDHFNLVWAGHEWPADAVLTVTKPEKKTCVHASIHNFESVWKAVEAAGKISKVWISIAPRSLDAMQARVAENIAWNIENAEIIAANPAKKRQEDIQYIRGNGSEIYPMPAYFVDLDVNEDDSEHGEHKLDKKAPEKGGKVFPSRATGESWIEDFPLKPTMKVWTGGGFHLWWAFSELMDTETEKGNFSRFKKYWEDIKGSTGLHIDTQAIELTRVGRPAGTPKGKGKPEVFYSLITTEEVNEDARYTVADFDFLPVVVPRTATKRVKKDDGTYENRPISARSQAELDDLPGTKLGHYLPVSSIMEDVFWFDRSGDAYADPTRANYTNTTVDAHLYTANDGAEVVKIYDEGMAHDLKVQAGKSMTSFGLLIGRWCDGDVRLAARIAAHYDNRGDDLLTMLQEELDVQELRARFPEPVLEVIVQRLPQRQAVAGAWWDR